MVIITGDTHGKFDRIIEFCEKNNTTTDDTMIILGDAGFNFWANKSDYNTKRKLKELPIKLFCIHGNHEIRPADIETYKVDSFWNGKVMIEPGFPNIIFAIDGEIYDIPTFNGIKKAIVCGGAYSVDKYYRILKYVIRHIDPASYDEEMLNNLDAFVKDNKDCEAYQKAREYANNFICNYKLFDACGWWNTEQPTEEIKIKVEQKLDELNWKIDLVFTHTTPLKYEPIEAFIGDANPAGIDKSTELWLDKIEEKLNYQQWFCGHYHIDKYIDKIRIVFNSYFEP